MERRLLFACINQSVLGPELPVNSGLAMKGHQSIVPLPVPAWESGECRGRGR